MEAAPPILGESDSEDELPGGWEERATDSGRVYYLNHLEKRTQWEHPRTGKQKSLEGPLPAGWTKRHVQDAGTTRTVFVNHSGRQTSYQDPRLAFAKESNAHSAPRQKFDASSKGSQVLHGRDLRGTTVLITGASGGIGAESAKHLARHKAKVIMSGSNMNRLKEARDRILEESPDGDIELLECDLSDLLSVHRAAAVYKTRGWALNTLILNAGVLGRPWEILSTSGVESTFGINHVGHFYLCQLLHPLLMKAAPSRVVVLSSESHRQASIWDPGLGEPSTDLLQAFSAPSASQYWGLHAYNASKLANVLFALELNRRLSPFRVTANACHPGNMVFTRIQRHSCLLRFLYGLVRPFVKSLDQASATPLFAAVAPELEGIGGAYLNNNWFAQPHPLALDTHLQLRLWELTESLIRSFEETRKVNAAPLFPARMSDVVR